MLLDNSAQARAGVGYDKAAFTIDFDARQAPCPQGTASSSWTPCRKTEGKAIVVSWPKSACPRCGPLATMNSRVLAVSGRSASRWVWMTDATS